MTSEERREKLIDGINFEGLEPFVVDDINRAVVAASNKDPKYKVSFFRKKEQEYYKYAQQQYDFMNGRNIPKYYKTFDEQRQFKEKSKQRYEYDMRMSDIWGDIANRLKGLPRK